MIDEVAIQQTINRYSEAASRADWSAVVATYAPDGVWVIASSGTTFEGRDAIREGLGKMSGAMEFVVQINAPAVIDVSGDTATARSVIREAGRVKGSDETFEALGFYADSLVRTSEGWRFSRRTFELKGLHRNPMVPGSAR